MSSFQADFNLAEAGLWFVVASVLAVKGAFSPADFRPTLWLLGSAFFAFGVSDLIEARTGAWWDPLGLLALKASCVVTFSSVSGNTTSSSAARRTRKSRPNRDAKSAPRSEPRSAPHL